MPKTSLSITLGDDGLYHARVFAADSDGKRISKRITGNSKKEARQMADQFKEEVKRQKPAVLKMTLREAAEGYIYYIGNKRDPLRESTMLNYRSYTRNYLLDISDTPIMDITEELLQDEVYKMEMKLGAQHIRNIMSFFVSSIKHYRKGFRPELELPPTSQSKVTVPDASVFSEKLHTLKNRPRIYLPVVLAAYCGLRRGEICALDLNKDIEYDVPYRLNGSDTSICVIHVTKTMSRVRGKGYEVFEMTKTKSGIRTLYAPEWISDLLKEARDMPGFTWPAPSSVSSAFRFWAHDNGIECTFHGLRHFFASIAKAMDIPDIYMMHLMGHANTSMTNYYQEIMNDKKLEVSDKLLSFVASNKQ